MSMDTLMGERKPLRVTLETADGKVITGKAVIGNLSFSSRPHKVDVFGGESYFVPDVMQWEITLLGMGEIEQTAEQFIADNKKRSNAVEWKCDYCGGISPRAKTKCPACGASRSFVYE